MALCINKVNCLNFEQFRDEIGRVLYFPTVAAGLWSLRPFRNVQHLHQNLSRLLDGLPLEGKFFGYFLIISRLTREVVYLVWLIKS